MKPSIQQMLNRPVQGVVAPPRPSDPNMEDMIAFRSREDIAAEVQKRMELVRELETQKAAWNAVAESLAIRNREVGELRADIERIRTEAERFRADNAKLVNDNLVAEKRLGDTTVQLDSLRGQITSETQSSSTRSSEQDKEISKLRAELDTANSSTSQLRGEIDRLHVELSKAKTASITRSTPASLQPFELQITSRDANGGIKTIAMVPKK